MDTDLERLFVKSYIVKQKRDRAAYELFDDEKRRHFMNKLFLYIVKDRMVQYAQSIADSSDGLRAMRDAGISEKCYVMHDYCEKSGYDVLPNAVRLHLFDWHVVFINPETGVAFFVDETWVSKSRPNILRRFILTPPVMWNVLKN